MSDENKDADTGNAGKDVRLPDDHPLVKAFAATKEQLQQAKAAALPADRLKELEDKAKRLDDLEEASKTEQQKLADQLAEATKALDGYRWQRGR
jgi:hypothetical protein